MTRSFIKYLLPFALAGVLLAIALMFIAPQWFTKTTGIPLWSATGFGTQKTLEPSYADVLEHSMASVVRIYSQISMPATSIALLKDPHYANLLEGQLIDAD
ncbi:hypothetical protein N9H26_00245, partial [bacterium]|nr:hypothetical protein [bacterium]